MEKIEMETCIKFENRSINQDQEMVSYGLYDIAWPSQVDYIKQLFLPDLLLIIKYKAWTIWHIAFMSHVGTIMKDSQNRTISVAAPHSRCTLSYWVT